MEGIKSSIYTLCEWMEFLHENYQEKLFKNVIKNSLSNLFLWSFCLFFKFKVKRWLQIYGQMVLDKGAKTIQWGRRQSF